MTLVAGVDSSTQSCTVVVRDAVDGRRVRTGSAPHPAGSEIDPIAWEQALIRAAEAAGGLDDVAAIAVGAQQHGYVSLDEDGAVVRPALLWNDTRSALQVDALLAELGGPTAWAEAVGSVPVASFTVTKARWVAEHEPGNAVRTAAVCLPHDWLSWRMRGSTDLAALTTDRGDASGTGWFDARMDRYRPDLAALALGHEPVVPTVVAPGAASGVAVTLAPGAVVAAGTGDNMAASLGLQTVEGDVVVSIGTSGVACAVSTTPTADPTGAVAGFADATGRFLPLVCTLNAARVLDAGARLIGVDHTRFAELALSAPSGCDGLVLVPYLDGERTPDLPLATGSLHGLTRGTTNPAHLARACVEGVLCGLADAVDALRSCGVVVRRVVLVGGGARSEAVRRIAPQVLGMPVVVPPDVEAVADGAARQAAWALSGSAEPPSWELPGVLQIDGDPVPQVRARYAEARAAVLDHVP